jgi:hypothetical protein
VQISGQLIDNNGQYLPLRFQLWLSAIKCIPAFQLTKIVGQNKQMSISRDFKLAGYAPVISAFMPVD